MSIAAVVPPSYFGRDHWSTFGYLAHCAIYNDGFPDREKMRVDTDTHPFLGNSAARLFPEKRYPTVLRGGVQMDGHDDYDCADDLEAAGLLVHIGTGVHPRYRLTERGWRVWEEVQRMEAARPRVGWSQFRPSSAAMEAPATVRGEP